MQNKSFRILVVLCLFFFLGLCAFVTMSAKDPITWDYSYKVVGESEVAFVITVTNNSSFFPVPKKIVGVGADGPNDPQPSDDMTFEIGNVVGIDCWIEDGKLVCDYPCIYFQGNDCEFNRKWISPGGTNIWIIHLIEIEPGERTFVVRVGDDERFFNLHIEEPPPPAPLPAPGGGIG